MEGSVLLCVSVEGYSPLRGQPACAKMAALRTRRVRATTDSSAGAAAANSAHTTTLANPNAPDFAWQRGYSWYPDTPGQYPAGKMDWYYSSGGLYDQAHHSNAQVHTSTLANPTSSDFVWQRGYSWYPDTPGQYPASKWDYYYSSGGLYDQVLTLLFACVCVRVCVCLWVRGCVGGCVGGGVCKCVCVSVCVCV